MADLTQLKQVAQSIAPPDVTVQVRTVSETGLPYSFAEIQQCLGSTQAIFSPDVPQGRILSILIVQEQAGLNAYLGGVLGNSKSVALGRGSNSDHGMCAQSGWV